MSGDCAHLTLVNLFRKSARLEGTPGFPVKEKRVLRRRFKIRKFGAEGRLSLSRAHWRDKIE